MTRLIIDFSHFSQIAPLSKRRRRSSVSFAEESLLLEYVDSQHEDKNDLFYSKHELRTIMERNIRVVEKMIESNMTMDQFATTEVIDTSIFLGRESWLSSPLICHKILERRKAHRRAVLCEHNIQRSSGINDPSMLAEISERESDWARRRARIIGLLHKNWLAP
jgi:hypothetical protein